MSKTKPITITINDKIEVKPDGIYRSEVVKSGNGAVIKFFKRFIKKKVIVLVEDKIK
jgi:putative transposon-encoded protein